MFEKTKLSQISLMAKLFRGFGDKTRLAILKSLKLKPLSVNQIVEKLDLPQSTVSTHLRCLKDCNLIRSERKSKKNFYSLASEEITEIIEKTDHLLKKIYLDIYECVNYDEVFPR